MIAYGLAWLLPLFAGGGLWCLAAGVPRTRPDVAAAAGGGWLGGVLLAGALACAFARGDTRHAFAHAAPWLFAFGVLAWSLVWLRARGNRARATGTEAPSRFAWRGWGFAAWPREWRRPGYWLWWLLLGLIAWRLGGLAAEALLRPVFPWDAWSAWMIKAKAWFLLGHYEVYVGAADWHAASQAAARTLGSWNYPELLAWIELWFASAAGGWLEPLVGVVWCGVCVAFALAAYGQWRAVGVDARIAMVLTYALVSLPLLESHVALAGYADVWIMAILGLATITWLRALVCSERGSWWVAIALAACLPAIKLEGAVWLACLGAIIALERVVPRWRMPVFGAAAGLAFLAALAGLLVFPLPELGWVRVQGAQVSIAAVGTIHLGWHEVGGALLGGLYLLPNWHLLWYALPLLVILRRARLRHDAIARLAGLLLIACLAFPCALFLFTDAAAWAADYTSANRIVLQCVAVVFAFAAMLLRGPPDASVVIAPAESVSRDRGLRDTAPSSARPSDPG
jgi:hypothetical protein